MWQKDIKLKIFPIKFLTKRFSSSKLLRNITEILRIILKSFKNVSENFDNYCWEFWELLHNMLRNISENSENYCGKFRKSYQNFGDFEKYLGHFREVVRRIISRNSSEIFDKYWGKFRELYRNISKIIFKNFEINFGRFPKILRIFLKSISKNFENYFVKFWQLSQS